MISTFPLDEEDDTLSLDPPLASSLASSLDLELAVLDELLEWLTYLQPHSLVGASSKESRWKYSASLERRASRAMILAVE